jgi:hypothetical protein
VSGQQTENEFSIGGQSTRRDWFHSVDGGSPSVPRNTANGSETVGQSESDFPVDYIVTTGCVDGVCPVPWATVTKASVAPKGDPVDHPEHYTAGKVEIIEILEQAEQDAPDPISGGLLWQTLKYLLRLWYKGNMLQDAKKARWYLNRLIDRLESDYV